MGKKIFIQGIKYILAAILFTMLAACSIAPTRDHAPKGYVDVSHIPNAQPKPEPLCKYGNPASYSALGQRIHVLKSANGYSKVGFASWYGAKFHKQLTSCREPYDMYAMTAASRDLPIPTYVQVTNLENNKSIIVRVNDRGPFVKNRIIDLSYVAAKKLGYANNGTTLVRVTAINPWLWAKQQQEQPIAPILAHASSTFYLQVGAFSSENNAEQFRQRIANLTELPVYVKTGYHNDTPVYRVQVGPLAATQSNDLRAKLEAQGLAPGIDVIG